ncbi:MAG: TOBE domain-containing protein, partial [Anaerolineae bacterium]
KFIGGDGPALVSPSGEFHLPIDAALAEKLPQKTPLKLGVRSEDLHIATDPAAGDLPAEVYVREPLGDETIYGLQFAGGHVMLAKAPPTLELDMGQGVGVNFERSRLHIFDTASGKALR